MGKSCVYYDQGRGYWRAYATHESGERVYIHGRFTTEDDGRAAVAQYWAEQGPRRESDAMTVVMPDNVAVIDRPPLTVDWSTFVYGADLHAPFHCKDYLKRMVVVARHYGITRLALGGDLFDFDSSSRHPKMTRQAGLNDTLRIGGDLLLYLAETFEQILLLPGNHDDRVGKKLEESLEFEALIHAAVRGRIASNRLLITDNAYAYAGPEETGWVFGHPPYYDSRAANGLAKAAARERRHAIGSHTHLQSLGWSDDGRYFLIYPGHLTEPSMTPYVMRYAGLSKFPTWRPGYVLVRNNVPQLFGEGLVHWGDYGC